MKFATGEFEIAMVTYNRCEFVEEWMGHCYTRIKERNIHLSIYDSSTNEDTQKYIEAFKKEKQDTDLEYHHVDAGIAMAYKPMLPLLNSASKYVWVVGDSRWHDFDVLDLKIFPYIKQEIDFVLIYIGDNDACDEKIYADKDEFLYECLYSLLCIGMSIYKTSLFEPLKRDAVLMTECDRKYKKLGGTAWLGYFLEMFALKSYTAVSSAVPIVNIKPDRKVVFWYKNFYEILIGDLCSMMDALPKQYRYTDKAIRELWKCWLPDGAAACYHARKSGDLNRETYQKYKENGMLDRCTVHGDRMERFAYAAEEELDELLKQELEFEKQEFKELCRRNLSKIESSAKGCQLWIYGAGMGGKVLAECLKEQNIPVCGFLDKEAETILSCEGLPVKRPEDVELENCYIVISLRGWGGFCVGDLMRQGAKRKRIFYISMEGSRKEQVVLVLGGTGYLGAKVVREIARLKEYRCCCTTRHMGHKPVKNVQYIESSAAAIEEFVRQEEVYLVLNMACSYDHGLLLYHDVIESNIAFPLNVLNLSVKYGIKNFITIGTGLPQDFNMYSVSKNCFSEFGKFYSNKHGINFLNVKLEMFYGADEPADRFLAYVADRLFLNERIDLTEGTQKRDIVYVEDVVRVILELVQKTWDGFVELQVGTGEAPTIREIVSYMKEITGSRSVLNWGGKPMRTGGEPDCIADLSLLDKMGISIQYDWKSGLRKMLNERYGGGVLVSGSE